MVIDILFAGALIFALIKGFQKGFVIALFSFVAYFIGLAAALKLSSSVGNYLVKDGVAPSWWLPVVSFLIVFAIVILLVNILARVIKSFLKILTLGWLDRLSGILIYVLLYTFILSILLFYAFQIGWISESEAASSKTWVYIEPLAPSMVEFTGKLIPFFANLFDALKEFFAGVRASL